MSGALRMSKMASLMAACVLLTSLAGATDMYDDLPGDMALMYQDHNYIDPGLGSSLPEMQEDSMRSLMLYKLLTALRNQAVAPNILAGPKWVSSDTSMVPPETFDMSMLRGSMMKRGSDGNVPKARAITKPGQKWKIKKGKVGSQMICYFKLCAFRPPNM